MNINADMSDPRDDEPTAAGADAAAADTPESDEPAREDAAQAHEAGTAEDTPPPPPEEPAAEEPAAEEPAAEEPAAEEPAAVEEAEEEDDDDDDDFDDEDPNEDVEPLELNVEEEAVEDLDFQWYILKVQVNREKSIRDALDKRVRMHGLEDFFREIIVPTEDVAEFTKAGKRRVVKKKLFPGYIMVEMALNDDTWFLVRETPGIGDFTGAAGKPSPMDPDEVEKIIRKPEEEEEGLSEPRAAIPFKPEDRVRVKDGNFQNFEGEVEAVDETHGRVTVILNIFGRPTPVELEHWQIESI